MRTATMQTPGGKYPPIIRSLERFGPALGMSQAQTMGLVRARTPAEFNALAATAMGGMTPFPVLSALDHYPEDFGLPRKAAAGEP